MNKGDVFTLNFSINENVYNGFLNTFNDFNPLHTDENFAQKLGFEGKVMHGNILNGFVSYFVGEKLPVKNVMIVSQTIKYYKPLYFNDKITFEAVLSEIIESVNMLEFKFTFKKGTIKVASGTINTTFI